MSDVELFISYASEDIAHARRLFQSLSDVPEIRLWMDKETLLPGDSWEDSIFSAIERSRFFIVLLSPTWVVKDGFVKVELAKAVECLRAAPEGSYTVLPVRLSPCDVEDEILTRHHFIDLFPNWDAGVLSIRKAIRTKIETDSNAAFDALRLCRYYELSKEVEWSSEYGEEMLRLPSETIIEFLDRKHDKFGDELYAISVLAENAAKARSSSLSDYVVRTFEIVRLCYIEHEIPEFYGTMLQCASLLSDRMRALFLRDVYNYYVQHLAGFFNGCWWADFALRDLAKHYICCKQSRDVSGVTIRGEPHFRELNVDYDVASTCLKTIRWDIRLMDLLVFYARRAGDPGPLYTALRILERSVAESRKRMGRDRTLRFTLDCPDFEDYRIDRKKYGIPELRADLPHPDLDNLLWADSREHSARIGLLYRIATYMSRTNPDYGRVLLNECVQSMHESNTEIATTLSQLPDDDRIQLLDAVELWQSDELAIRTRIKQAVV
jgi:hypothetical protein